MPAESVPLALPRNHVGCSVCLQCVLAVCACSVCCRVCNDSECKYFARSTSQVLGNTCEVCAEELTASLSFIAPCGPFFSVVCALFLCLRDAAVASKFLRRSSTASFASATSGHRNVRPQGKTETHPTKPITFRPCDQATGYPMRGRDKETTASQCP
jgi:hypothetical protein